MSECRQGGDNSTLLSPALARRRDKNPCILAPVTPSCPLATSCVPKRLPLCREVAKTCWNPKEKSIVFCEGCGIDEWIIGLGWGIHLWEKGVNKSLADFNFETARTLVRMSWGRVSGILSTSQKMVKSCSWVLLLIDIGQYACLVESLLLCLGQLLNVAIHGILDLAVRKLRNRRLTICTYRTCKY